MKAIGFTCDRLGCGTFAVGSGKDNTYTPEGWIRVAVTTGNGSADTLELCGEACVVAWATERGMELGTMVAKKPRARAEGGRVNQLTEEGRALMRMNAIRTSHKKGHHDKAPNDECELCEKATQP